MPKGQRRPADVIGNAVKMTQIATGNEVDAANDGKNAAAKLSDERKKEIARRAAAARWKQD